jgi:hypothetical protein
MRTLALTSLLQGRYEQAEDELRECLYIASELGDLAGAAMDLDRLGQAAVALGRPEAGVVLAGAAGDGLRQSVGGALTVEAFRWRDQAPARCRPAIPHQHRGRASVGERTQHEPGAGRRLHPHRVILCTDERSPTRCSTVPL